MSRRIVAIVNPATHGNAAAIVDLLRRHAPADADLDVRLTSAAGTTTALPLIPRCRSSWTAMS
jgi:hypothetical protein